jgi:hypothetical protein
LLAICQLLGKCRSGALESGTSCNPLLMRFTGFRYFISGTEESTPKSMMSSNCISIWKNFAAIIGDISFEMRSKIFTVEILSFLVIGEKPYSQILGSLIVQVVPIIRIIANDIQTSVAQLRQIILVATL